MLYRIGPDVAAEDFDGDSIVLDLQSGRYFSFSDSGSLVWQALSRGVDSDELISLGAGSVWAEGFAPFIAELLASNLLVGTDEKGTELPEEIRPRFTGLTETLTVSVFDDLADLFIADPIHDVEAEAGWPIKKES